MKKELGFFLMLLWIVIFLIFNYEPSLAIAYLALMIVTLWSSVGVFHISFPIERRTDNRIKAVLWALGAFLVFTRVAPMVSNLFGMSLDSQSIMSLFASLSPLLQSKWMKFFSFGVLIPIVETIAFARLMEWLSNWIKTKETLKSFGMWIVIPITSLIFSLFHLTAKGLYANSLLFVTFLFMVLSLVMVLKFKELKQAILFHIIINSVALGGILYTVLGVFI